jgi:hypothetical protein
VISDSFSSQFGVQQNPRAREDLTRTTPGLLVFSLPEGVSMLEPKTHYEQVPLEIVRKIVEEQIQLEINLEQTQESKELLLEGDLLEEQDQSIVRALTSIRRSYENNP